MRSQIKALIFRWLVVELPWVGQRRGWDWLTYHPGVFVFFHWVAVKQAPAVARSLDETFPNARSYADVGAGTGVYAARLHSSGRAVAACEHSRVGRWIARAQGVRAVPFGLTREPSALIGAHDLAFSFEVAEHLPASLARRLVELLLGTAPIVVFNAAQPGQGGQGHVNEQPLSYWVEEFERIGGRLDADGTHALRASLKADGSVNWTADNVQVFRRG
jgi:hypothetical protein